MNESFKSLSDHELYDLLKDGNNRAYYEIYDRYSERLYLHAFKRLAVKEDCRDIVQNIFITLWEKKDSLSINENLSNYLFTSVRNAIFNLLNRKKISDNCYISIAHFAIGYDSSTDYSVREKQLSEKILLEIEQLSPRTKEIFKLSRYNYLTHKQIADKLNISEQTVKSAVNDALKVLRVKLGSFLFLFF